MESMTAENVPVIFIHTYLRLVSRPIDRVPRTQPETTCTCTVCFRNVGVIPLTLVYYAQPLP